jgi:hypothetical protein
VLASATALLDESLKLPKKAPPRSEWMTRIWESPPGLCHHSFSHQAYLPERPWLHRLSTPEFAEWFRSQSDLQPDGCRSWRPDDFRVTLDEGWSEDADRIGWCLANRKEPGEWLVFVRDCPKERCVEPTHLFDVGNLADFYAHVKRDDRGCWVWQGSRTRDGYGRYFVDGGEVRAHVFAWEYENVIVPRGKCVCHHCDNPPCVNPKHLFLADHRGNMADMVAKGRQARGVRHPQAYFGPEFVQRVLFDLLNGMSVSVASRIWGVSETSLRAILRGEHWTQRDPQDDHGRILDLGMVEVRGRMGKLEGGRAIGLGLTVHRFRIHPYAPTRDLVGSTPEPIACVAAITDDKRALLEGIDSRPNNVVVRGRLGPYAGTRGAGRKPAFEVAAADIKIYADEGTGEVLGSPTRRVDSSHRRQRLDPNPDPNTRGRRWIVSD